VVFFFGPILLKNAGFGGEGVSDLLISMAVLIAILAMG
jgi:hypothetical protein